jgi:conjugative relaxase-like TrwC/TraI family protein
MVTGFDKFGKNGARMNSRHYRHNDYYEKGHTIPGIGFGKLSYELGIENGQPINDETFRSLSGNQHAVTEKRLTRHVPDRKPFCDITCSAPKTFSIDYVLAGNSRSLGYHRKATEKVIGELHRLVGRQAHNGKEHLERTGNLSGVAYEHDSNRCQEVQMHTHLIVWNVTKSANGKLYAIDFREFLDQRAYLTAVYRDELARLALADGLHLTVGEHGQPEITELMEMAKDHQRRSDEMDTLIERIEDYAGTKLTDREAALIVRASRGLDVQKFEQLWDANKSALDTLKTLDPESAENDRRELLQRFTAIVQQCSDSGLRKISASQVRAEQQARVTPEQRRLLESIKDPTVRDLVGLVPDLDKSIDYAVAHCFQNASVIKTYELYEVILQHAQGAGVDLDEMRAKVAKHPGVILGLHNEIGSAEHHRQEMESTAIMNNGKGRGQSIVAKVSDRLSDPQRVTVKSLLESRDQFTALSGSAGVGKTEFVLAEVIHANVAAGHRVVVVAPSDAARDVLHHDAKKLGAGTARDVLSKAVSLQLFQADPNLHQSLGSPEIPIGEYLYRPPGAKPLVAGDLLIIDEASFISLKQGHEEVTRAAQRGVRVLLVGDLDQEKSIQAGDFFRLALKSGIHVAELHDIKRQSPKALDGHYLTAVKLFKRGRTTEAFGELNKAGCIHELKGQHRVEAIADAILKSEASGVSTMCANFTHRENDAIGAMVRTKMKATGQLTDERTLAAHQTLGWTDAQKKDVSRLRPGHVLEITRGKDKGAAFDVLASANGIVTAHCPTLGTRSFTKANFKTFDVCEQRQLMVAIGDKLLARSANKKGELINGKRLTVTGWDSLGNPVADGRSIEHRNICYGYASTARKVQGSTCSRIITGFDRHSVKSVSRDIPYVLNSRGRDDCQIYVESIADLSQTQDRTGIRKAVIEMEKLVIPVTQTPVAQSVIAQAVNRGPIESLIRRYHQKCQEPVPGRER